MTGSDTCERGRYRIRRKPGNVLRVDDMQEGRADGYWNCETKSWFPLTVESLARSFNAFKENNHGDESP